MACTEGKCVLCMINPKSNAGLACDSDCYLDDDESNDIRPYYKRKFPEFMKHYKDKNNNK